VSVFVDTSALYAFLDGDNTRSPAAKTEFASIVESERLVTHNYVVVETASLVHRRLGSPFTRALFEELVPLIDVHWVDERTHTAAVSAHLATQSRRVSLIDLVSFEVMRRNGIRMAFCFDPDFSRQGFDTRP
jgi:predicted nucleic acid-binding protein